MSQNQKPIRALILQLTRLGDTLQSLMALRAAKQLYPNLEITFVARERFAAAAKRVPWIHEVVTLPTDSILGPVLNGQKKDLEAMPELARWISPLAQNPWDMIVNWSYSESSSYLAGLLPGRVKLGYSRKQDLTLVAADGWSHYIQAIVQGRVAQNIHLTDILTTQLLTALQIHFGEPANDGNAPVTSKSFFSLELGEQDSQWSRNNSAKKWIGLQLGAGNEAKTWSPQRWASLAAIVLERHPEYGIVLMGGQEEQLRVRAFMAELTEKDVPTKNVISLVGQSDFDLWASVIARCSWVFSADTAAIHLASVLGTRVLNLSVGPVRWHETGPYGNGHYVIAPALPCTACIAESEQKHSCKEDITPEMAYAVWSYGATEWAHRRQIPIEDHLTQLEIGHQTGAVRVMRSKIRDTNDGGGVFYEPMLKRSIDLEDWTAMVMGYVARAWYCGWVPSIGHELGRDTINPGLIQKLRALDEGSEVLLKVCDEARDTATSLNQKSAKLKSEKIMGLKDRQELHEMGKRLMALDDLVERLGRTQPPLIAFHQMSKVLMHNLRSTHLADLGKESADCYRQLREGIVILRAWVKFTMGLAKPVALKPVSGADPLMPAPIKEI